MGKVSGLVKERAVCRVRRLDLLFPEGGTAELGPQVPAWQVVLGLGLVGKGVGEP